MEQENIMAKPIPNDEEIFQDVVIAMKNRYPNRGIYMRGRVVYIDGSFAFNSDGKSLLRNLNTLTYKLKDEIKTNRNVK